MHGLQGTIQLQHRGSTLNINVEDKHTTASRSLLLTGLAGARATLDTIRDATKLDDEKKKRYTRAALYLMDVEMELPFVDYSTFSMDMLEYRLMYHHWLSEAGREAALMIIYTLSMFQSPFLCPKNDEGLPLTCSRITSAEPDSVFYFEIMATLYLIINIIAKKMVYRDGFVKEKRNTVYSAVLVCFFLVRICSVTVDGAHYELWFLGETLKGLMFLRHRDVFRVVKDVARTAIQLIPALAYYLTTVAMTGVIAHILYSDNDYMQDEGFGTLYESVRSIFIMSTTANFPDIMLPTYARYWSTGLFFIVAVLVMTYFYMNLIMMIVYSAFKSNTTRKKSKRYRRSRMGTHAAFREIDTGSDGLVSFDEFISASGYIFLQEKQTEHLELIWTVMNKDNDEYLTEREFHRVVSMMDVRVEKEVVLTQREEQSRLRRLVRNIDLPIGLCTIGSLILYFSLMGLGRQNPANITDGELTILFVVECIFVVLLLVEIGAEVYVSTHISQHLDIYLKLGNLVVYGSALALLICGGMGELLWGVKLSICFRITRVRFIFALFEELKEMAEEADRIRQMLLPVFFCLLFWIYVNIILSMLFFGGKITLESADQLDAANYPHYFYSINFNSAAEAAVTLLSMMIVNNWHVIMLGVSAVTSDYCIIYFVAFYLVTSMIIVNIVIAFFLDVHSVVKVSDKQDDEDFQRAACFKSFMEAVEEKAIQNNVSFFDDTENNGSHSFDDKKHCADDHNNEAEAGGTHSDNGGDGNGEGKRGSERASISKNETNKSEADIIQTDSAHIEMELVDPTTAEEKEVTPTKKHRYRLRRDYSYGDLIDEICNDEYKTEVREKGEEQEKKKSMKKFYTQQLDSMKQTDQKTIIEAVTEVMDELEEQEQDALIEKERNSESETSQNNPLPSANA